MPKPNKTLLDLDYRHIEEKIGHLNFEHSPDKSIMLSLIKFELSTPHYNGIYCIATKIHRKNPLIKLLFDYTVRDLFSFSWALKV